MRLRLPVRTLSALLLVAVFVSSGRVETAQAEAVRTVGDYVIGVSFARSPVYPNEPLEFLLRVTTLDGTPVTGLEETLLLRVSVPNQVTETLAVGPLADRPGVYKVDLLFLRAGIYNLHVLGAINGQRVNEQFLTGKDGLDKVIVRDGKSYPKGSGWVVAVTFGAYLVGLAGFGVYYLNRWRRRQRPVAAGS